MTTEVTINETAINEAANDLAVRKVYLAAMYQWMDRMKVEREKFHAAGYEVTAQWIDNGEESEAIVTRHDAAQMDLNDIDRADIFVLFTLDHGTMFSSGGRMVELGYAMARGKAVFIIGDRENVFCHHDTVTVCRDVQDALVKIGLYRDAIEQRTKTEMGKLLHKLEAKFIDDSLGIKEAKEGSEPEFKHPGKLW